MAKYSTGGAGGSDEEGACELCGHPADRLEEVSVAGAQLAVCRDCAPHDDRTPDEARDQTGRDQAERRRRAAQQTAKVADAQQADSDYWVQEGTDYESDPLPYLVSEYGERLQEARQSAGLTPEELAEQAEISVQDIEAIEQNRAARAGVGGSTVRTIETELDISLIDED